MKCTIMLIIMVRYTCSGYHVNTLVQNEVLVEQLKFN